MKTDITREIEYAVYNYFYIKRGYRCGFEVHAPRGMGRVDLFGLNEAGRSICVEIKISRADFNSKNGHNFFGNLNYYAVPKDLVEYVKTKVADGIGIISFRSQYELFKEHMPNIKKSQCLIIEYEKKAKSIEQDFSIERLQSHLFTAMASNVMTCRMKEINASSGEDHK